MKLDVNKFKTDDSRSNPMVIAQRYQDCPINEICAFVVIGFGQIAEKCKHFEDRDDSAYCLYDEPKKEKELKESPNE